MEPKAEFNFMLYTVLRYVSELGMKAANAEVPEEACQHLQKTIAMLTEVEQLITKSSRKGRKKTSEGVALYKIADHQKAIFVVRCWLMYKDGVFDLKYPKDAQDKGATNFMKVMTWLGSCIGEDFSDAEQLLDHALEQEDILTHFQDDIVRLAKRINDKRIDRAMKNIARSRRKSQENR